jgi:phosphoribosylanthranilate isomerase
MAPRVKICGVTRVEDARAAVEAGADAIGFVFYPPSPRAVALERAVEIARELPPFVARVGVFVDPEETAVRNAAELAGLTALQFHGSESPEFCRRFRIPVIKAFRMQTASSLDLLEAYRELPWLLDSFAPGQLGGTGVAFDWALAQAAKQRNPRLILAGGLTATNVAEAVRQVAPYAVDVSSGVEVAPGVKDHAILREFIRAAVGVVS